MNSKEIYLEGQISVEAAISSGFRSIQKVYIDKEKYLKRDRKITHLISILKKHSIYFELCEREFIDGICEGTSHGGVCALAGDRGYCDIGELISSLGSGEYLCCLDGVEDPFNFGYSIRNMYAFGCRGFIIPERNWMSSANIVAKSSAGASELCDMALFDSDEQLLCILKEKGVDIVCSALSSSSIPLFDFRPSKPFILFIGGEKRGISKLFMENATKVVHIPYTNDKARYSLPTASCAAIFASYLSK